MPENMSQNTMIAFLSVLNTNCAWQVLQNHSLRICVCVWVCVSCSLSSICALLTLGINELLLSFGAQHANKQLEIRQPRGCCGVGERAKCCDYILTSPFWEEWVSLMLLKGGSCSGRQTKESLHAPALWYVQEETFCGGEWGGVWTVLWARFNEAYYF